MGRKTSYSQKQGSLKVTVMYWVVSRSQGKVLFVKPQNRCIACVFQVFDIDKVIINTMKSTKVQNPRCILHCIVFCTMPMCVRRN